MSLKANILLAMFRIGRDVEAHLAQLRQEGNHKEEGAAGEACPLPAADVLLSAASRHPALVSNTHLQPGSRVVAGSADTGNQRTSRISLPLCGLSLEHTCHVSVCWVT